MKGISKFRQEGRIRECIDRKYQECGVTMTEIKGRSKAEMDKNWESWVEVEVELSRIIEG